MPIAPTGLKVPAVRALLGHMAGRYPEAGLPPFPATDGAPAARDRAEFGIVDHFRQSGLVAFAEPCVAECHEGEAACRRCLEARGPAPAAVRRAKEKWRRGPLPGYCKDRVALLRKEKRAGRCAGVCGAFSW